MKTLPLLLGIALLTALLAGCSGSGVSSPQLSGATIRTTASDHLSTIALLAGWLKVLYYIVPPGPGFTYNDEPTWPDGTYHCWGTNSDSSSFEYWQAADGSGHGTLTWPGMSVTETYGVPTTVGDLFSQQATQAWSTGLTLTILVEIDSSLPGAPQTWSGQATIPGSTAVKSGTTMDYTLQHNLGQDHLTLHLPDGAVLDFTTPVTTVAGAAYWPQFATGATANYTGPNGTLTYHLRGAGDAGWTHMSFTADGGFAGDFSVDANFVGSGQLTENGSVAGALNWNAAATGQLNLLGVGVEEVSPSAAARDFRLEQWSNQTALMGPMPMY
jgi:hypothetical protein